MKKEAVFLSELISKMKPKCNLVELCMRDYLPVAVHLTYFVLRFWILPHSYPRTRKIGQFTSLNWPYKPQYQHAYSPHCLLYIPYGIAGENLLKPQDISPLVITSFIVVTCMFAEAGLIIGKLCVMIIAVESVLSCRMWCIMLTILRPTR